MDLDDIKQILDLVREHDLAEFELERDGLKVRVRKAGREVTLCAAARWPSAPAPVAVRGRRRRAGRRRRRRGRTPLSRPGWIWR